MSKKAKGNKERQKARKKLKPDIGREMDMVVFSGGRYKRSKTPLLNKWREENARKSSNG